LVSALLTKKIKIDNAGISNTKRF